MGIPKPLRVRFWIVAAVLAVGAVCLVPTLAGQMPPWWERLVPVQKLRLGLDLKGGIHLVLGVQVDKAVENQTERVASDLKDVFRRKHYGAGAVRREGLDTVVIPLREGSPVEKIRLEIDGHATFETVSETPDEIRLRMRGAEADRIRRYAVDQGLETIRNRIDQYGVAETTVVKQGDNRILVELPGVSDPKRAIELIGKTALLEFKLVDENRTAEDALRNGAPPGSEVLYHTEVDPGTGRAVREPYLIEKRVLLTGDELTDAKVEIGGGAPGPHVTMAFNRRGTRDFARITTDHVRRRLAIVLDGNVYSAPVIQEPITGGRAQITGRFTMEEATDLAIVLRAGSLPAPVEILENRTVGPSLGADLIRKGVTATLIGAAAVVAFMAVYYLLSGLVANFALMVNLFLLIGLMSALGAALTLPGIAGIVLTLGMAVDANVLIFERIREELRAGRTVKAAVENGYNRAFVTILDSNVTTVLTAVVLLIFGSGPVKGFAVTLTVGLAVSMFTAIVVTRLIFEYVLMTRPVSRLSI